MEAKNNALASGELAKGAHQRRQGKYSTTGQELCSSTPLYPFYETVSDTSPANTLNLTELVWLAIDPTVKPKTEAAALTPFRADSKKKEVAEKSQYHALITDHDDDDKSADEIRACYDQWQVAYLAYTSASHEQEKNGVIGKRWKPVIPLAYPVDYERYKILSGGLMLLNGTDSVQSRSQQVFFAPNLIEDGAPYDCIDETSRPFLNPYDDSHPLVKACTEAYEAETARQEAEASKAAPKPRPANLTGEQAGIIDKVKAAYSGAEPQILEQFGYKRIGRRYLSPWSSTGTPGVMILDSGKVYSHHGESDPLSNLNHEGHALDVFDLLCIFRFDGDLSQAVAELANDVDPEGQKQRQRAHMAAEERAETTEQLGSTVTKPAQEIADYIHSELLERLEVDPDGQPEEAESLKPDAEIITRMINGAFWSGSKSKVFLLNRDENLIQFTERDSFKFIARTFGNVIDRKAVIAMANLLNFGEEGSKASEEKRQKHINSCMAVAKDAILDYLKYQNQRESIEWRVDMFGKLSRLELLEDKARIVLTHKPFPKIDKPEQYARIIADYKEHFSRFDEFLQFLVASRFTLDRKKSYLWILADSDWGKGFLTGVLANLGACVETSMKEVEAMLEGKPVGRSAEDFKRAFVLLIDEFKTVKSELKQLQSEITLSPKNQLSCTVEVFAKVFTSAESVDSLVTENGVEDQFANRMSIFQEEGDITKRPVFQEVGNARYFRAVLAYTAEFLNTAIASATRKGRDIAETEAEEWLNNFIQRYGLDTVYERFSDSLPGLAAEMVEYFTSGKGNFDDKIIRSTGAVYLTSPAKAVDDYLVEHFDHSQITAFRKRKGELIRLMCFERKGNITHRINGEPKKAVKLEA